MRPQQQNRRMRGRNGGGSNNNNNNNNNNRRGPNPLTRNYESNGPDVKIRGSAQQIAEKYTTLARDAQSAGDRVMAENYLQHAEHYNRIIAAAQAQMPIQNTQNQRDVSEDDSDDERDDFDGGNAGNNAPQQNAEQSAQEDTGNGNSDNPGERENNGNGDRRRQQQHDFVAQGSGPQPEIEGVPAEVALNPEAAGEGNAAQRAANGEGREPARRSRRPRRGERSRPDGEEDSTTAGEGLAATLSRGGPVASAKQPAPEAAVVETTGGSDAALADADT